MPPLFDLILQNGTVMTPAGAIKADVAVKNGKIADIGSFGDSAAEIIDCTNLHILPGVIDAHTHFREPGFTHKEDIATGSLSAIMGGVTTIFEMPNTEPLTITAEALADKLARAQNTSFCDYAFYIGGCAENAHLVGDLERVPGCAGIKVFMGSSTGALLAARDEEIESILRHGSRRVALHAEDEARLIERKHLTDSGDVKQHPNWRDAETALKASMRAVHLARKTGRKIHILHATTGDEMAYLRDHKDIATVETTPQHLTLFAPDAYDKMGTRAQMNPPIRDKAHQDALWHAVRAGVVDVLGSDHAPHTLDEKSKPYPASPSGMPGVQTLLPVMLTHVNAGRLTLERLVDLTAHGPQRVHQIACKGRIAAGYDADFAIVDLKKQVTVTDRMMMSKCGWTPYDGMQMTGWVIGTFLRGRLAQWEGEMPQNSESAAKGQAVRFVETLGENSALLERLMGSNIQSRRPDCC